MQRAWDIELIFPIKDVRRRLRCWADCLDKAGIISEVRSNGSISARTFVDYAI